jgi:DNA-binding MarR family transcriptional regulator
MATARAVRQAYDRCLAEVGVNLTEASLLAHLGNGGQLTQVELARRVGTSRARIGVNVDSLEAKGAVERRSDPTDRRVWLVSLTEAGRDLWARTIKVDRHVRTYLRLGTTAAERKQLDALLERIHRNIETMPKTPPDLDGEDEAGSASDDSKVAASDGTGRS